jgi:hypothetical protein
MATKKAPPKAAKAGKKAKRQELTFTPLDISGNYRLSVPGTKPGAWISSSSPCGGKFKGGKPKGCPIQYIFAPDGTPHLRLCTASNRPGFLVKVESPVTAYAQAVRLCREGGYYPNPQPFSREVAERAKVPLEAELGRLRRPRKRSR